MGEIVAGQRLTAQNTYRYAGKSAVEPTSPIRTRIRLVDVAELAGVTKSVASRVLNGDTTINVRPSTKQRILDAARTLNYAPHAGAKALAGARTKALALLIPDLMNSAYARIARGAYQRAREYGYVVLLAEDTEDSNAQSDFTDLVGAGRVEGLLIASARAGHPLLEMEQLERIPHVFVNRAVPGTGRNVTVDLQGAGRAAFDYLRDLGHVHMAHISGPGALMPAQERERGFLGAATAAGYPEPFVARDAFTEAGGFRAAEQIAGERSDVTAVFVGTFSQSVGALKALRNAGIRVPEDMSVLSYDDLPVADYLEPSLSTMSVPLQELGQLAVDALIHQLQGVAPKDLFIPAEPTILERDSTAPPGGAHS